MPHKYTRTCLTRTHIYVSNIHTYRYAHRWRHSIVLYSIPELNHVPYSKPGTALQHTATYCNILQHTATHCNTIDYDLLALQAQPMCPVPHCNTLKHTATQSIATCPNPKFNRVPYSKPGDTLQHAATRCNTLQHAATRCNTLQHVAIYYNILQYTAA